MKILKTNIEGCMIIEPEVFEDCRGFFIESYNHSKYLKILGLEEHFAQDNHSHSLKNVLRGIHIQRNKPQGKLVRVVNGEVYDVVVDLREESLTFGQWESFILSAKNKKQLWVPPGFGHGFVVLSETADFEYKCSNYYDPNDEFCIKWDDPDLKISWPVKKPILSEKDLNGISLADYKK